MDRVNVIVISLIVLLIVIGAIFLFSSQKIQEERIIQSVSSNNQEIIDNKVLVSRVVSDGSGWIVIHIDNAGKPGQIIGYSSISKGSNTNVLVTIDSSEVTPRLFAMLHVDKGVIRSFEFPGIDVPERHEDETIIVAPFNVEIETEEETAQTEEIPAEPLVSIKEFTIEADDSGLYPSSIEVDKGDTVKITFKVRSQGTYFGGLDFRSDVWGDTGKVSKGQSTSVEFVAEETFQFKSYWPASNRLKATGTVTVK